MKVSFNFKISNKLKYSQDYTVYLCVRDKPKTGAELINKKYKKYSTEFILFLC